MSIRLSYAEILQRLWRQDDQYFHLLPCELIEEIINFLILRRDFLGCTYHNSCFLDYNNNFYTLDDNLSVRIVSQENLINDRMIFISSGFYYHIVLTEKGRAMYSNTRMDSIIFSSVTFLACPITEGLWRSLSFSNDTKIIFAARGPCHALLITDRGSVFSLGSNEEGQLGRNGDFKPAQISILEKTHIISGACSRSASVLLDQNGKVWFFGKINLDYNTKKNIRELSLQLNYDCLKNKNIKSVHCGYQHIVLIEDRGRVYSFGNNVNSELGRRGDESTPMLIENLENERIISGSCGDKFTLLLNNRGQVFSFCETNSRNSMGFRNFFENIKIIALSSSGNFTLLLNEKGRLYRMKYISLLRAHYDIVLIPNVYLF